MENLFDISSASPYDEVAVSLLSRKNLRIEKIISTGQTTGWYDQSEAEWVCVIKGEGELTFEDGRILLLKAGDCCFIKEHERHRVSYTSDPCIWLCVFATEDTE